MCLLSSVMRDPVLHCGLVVREVTMTITILLTYQSYQYISGFRKSQKVDTVTTVVVHLHIGIVWQYAFRNEPSACKQKTDV